MVSPCKKAGILFTISTALIICGISVGVLWSSIFNKFLIGELALTSTSKTFEMWKKTPIPMYLKVHFFNWTNPNEFHSGSSTKPNFVEMGPYVFSEVDYKTNPIWNDNDTVTIRQRKVWHFQPSMSNGRLDDLVTNANPVAATVAYSFRTEPKIVKKFISKIMERFNENLVVTKTVRELLFDGYEDRLLSLALKLNVTKLPFEKFGWFYSRNNSDTYDGTFNIARGIKDIHEMANVVEWNFNKKAKKYTGQCDIVKGIIGDLWPPLVDNQTISIFIPDICTHVKLTRSSSSSEYLGLKGYTYAANKETLDNGTKVPSRKCYCTKDECQPSGILNVSPCKYGAPVFFGLPHFYLADETYLNAVSGLHPDKEKHEFEMTVEPTTGIPLQVRVQLQLSILIQPDEVLSLYKNVPKTYIPLIWFRQEVNLTSDLAKTVKVLLILPMLGHVTLFGIAGIGAFLFFLGVCICYRGQWKNEDNQVLLKD